MLIRVMVVAATCSWLMSSNALGQSQPTCPKGFQPYANRCISQRMADYVSCVEVSGGNSERVAIEVTNAKGANTGVGVKGSGSGVIAKGSGSVTVDHATEQALASKFEQIWKSNGMEECRKVLDPPRPPNPKTPSSPKSSTEVNSTQQNQASAKKQPEGSDNTTYGNVAPPEGGSRNTFVGPTDAHGNTVIPAGTAVGYGAHADPSSVAIGSGAGPQAPAKQQQCQAGSICNQDSPNLGTQEVNNYGPKLPTFLGTELVDKDSQGSAYATTNQAGHALTHVRFYADSSWDDPRIGVLCDRPCTADQVQQLRQPVLISPSFLGASSPSEPNVAIFIFTTLKPMAADTYYVLTVASLDSSPVRILKVAPFIGKISPH